MSDNPEESAYYLRLMSMYMDLCTESVRNVFNFHSPDNDGEKFILLHVNQAKLTELKSKKVLDIQQSKLVITQWPNLKSMDISLLITLSINLCTPVKLPPPVTGWDRPPKGKDISIAADLLRLKKIRNTIIAHYPHARLPQWRFEEDWKTIKIILLRIEHRIAPKNEEHLKSIIDQYLIQELQPSVKDKHDPKLREWYQEVSKVQEQVDKYAKTLEEFNVYFKSKSSRYERYIKLLIKGGQFVLAALIKAKCQQRDLRSILDEKEQFLKDKITDPKHLEIIYPSESDHLLNPLDLSKWDISLLADVLLYAFEVNDAVKRAVNNINNARKNYAETAVKALDPDSFVDHISDLKKSIDVASDYLKAEEKTQIEEILEECKKTSKEDGSLMTYMNELRSQGLQMQTLSDIYNETVQKIRKHLQDMITCGISFNGTHMLELKMITVGSGEQKKKVSENILFEVWQAALDNTKDKNDFPEIEKEVNKILEEIRKMKGVQNVDVKQECILLQMSCRNPRDMLDLIEYFDSDLFRKHLADVCKEVGFYCDTIVAIRANVTIESLDSILNTPNLQEKQETGIRVPITVSSPAAMVELRKFFQSEEFINGTNAIAEELSKHTNSKVELRSLTDMKEFNAVLDGVDTDDGSSDSSSTTGINQPLNTGSGQQDLLEDQPQRPPGQGTNEETNNEETVSRYRNFVCVYLGFAFVGQILEIYTRNGLQRVHQRIYNMLAGEPPCIRMCGKEPSRWCKTCRKWQQNLRKFCRDPNIAWSKQEPWKWPLSYEHIAGIFTNKLGDCSVVNIRDLRSTCDIWRRCREFNINPFVLQNVKSCMTKYFAQRDTLQVTDLEKEWTFEALEDLLQDGSIDGLERMHCLDELRNIQSATNNSSASLTEIIRERENLREDKHTTFEKYEPIGAHVEENTIKAKQKAQKKVCCLSVVCMVVSFLISFSFRDLLGGGNSSRGHTYKNDNIYSGCLSEEFMYPFPLREQQLGFLPMRNSFVGRERVFDMLEQNLLTQNTTAKSKGMLIIAGAGFGKSAIVAHLLCARETEKGWTLRKHIVAFHVCRFDQGLTQNPVQFIKRLIWFLSLKSAEYAQYVSLLEKSIIYDENECEKYITECFDVAVTIPLSKLGAPNDAPWIVVIDALGECTDASGKNRILELLLDHFILQGKGLRWFKWMITSRYKISLTKLDKLNVVYFPVKDERNEDIRQSVSHYLFSESSGSKKYFIRYIRDLLFRGVADGSTDIVSFIHENIAPVNELENFLVHKAAIACSKDLARYLIDVVKVSPWERDEDGLRANDIACKKGCVDVLNVIVENDPSLLDMQCLLYAAKGNPMRLIDVIEVYVANGIKLGYVKNTLQREMLIQIIHIILGIHNLLHGSPTYMPTPVEMITDQYPELLSFPDVQGFTPTLKYVVLNATDFFLAVLEKGIDVICQHVSNVRMYTHYAFGMHYTSKIVHDSFEYYRYLDRDVSCPEGASVEHLLMRYKRMEMIKSVIANDHIMNWTKTDSDGKSPLDYADPIFIKDLERFFDVDIHVLSEKDSLVRLCSYDRFDFGLYSFMFINLTLATLLITYLHIYAFLSRLNAESV